MWLRRLLLGCALCIVQRATAAGTLPPANVVVDANSGVLLFGARADDPYPAGKLHHWLVLLAAQEQASLGTLPLDAPVAISRETVQAFAGKVREGATLDPARTYLLSDLLKALALSGSDLMAVVAAEAMWGASDTALESLNEYARKLGLVHTQFASWRSDDPGNSTTAKDAATVAVRLAKPGSMVREWATIRAFPFDGGRVVVGNRMAIADSRFAWSFRDRVGTGGKTVVRLAAACRESEELRFLALSLGAATEKEALNSLADNLAAAEQEYRLVPLVRAGEPLRVEVEVEGGISGSVVPVAELGFSLPVRPGSPQPGLRIRYQLPSAVTAPVARGEILGEVIVELDDRVLAVIPAVSPKTIEAHGVRAAQVGNSRRLAQ